MYVLSKNSFPQKFTSESGFWRLIISLNFGNPLLEAAAFVPDAADIP